MYVRCTGCRQVTRVPLDAVRPTVTCVTCGRIHDTRRSDAIGRTPSERFRTAQAFAQRHGLDLASAYSVLLGIMPIEDAPRIDLSTLRLDACPWEHREPGEVSDSAGAGEEHPHYDRAFQDAVAAGYLTIRMATERGERVTFASRVTSRYGVPMSLAFEVADNRISLKQALAQNSEDAGTKHPGPPTNRVQDARDRPRSWRSVAIVTLLLALVALAIGFTTPRPVAPPPPLSTPGGNKPTTAPRWQAATVVRSDGEGRLTQLVGPSPRWVLETYCSAQDGAKRALVRTEPGDDGWLGVFKEAGQVLAIRIERRNEDGGWGSGDGLQPIPTIPRDR